MSEELRPCPFCGYYEESDLGILILRPDYLEPRTLETLQGYSRMCGQCGCRTATAETLEEANNRWNARASDKQLASAVETIRHYAIGKRCDACHKVYCKCSPSNQNKAAEWLRENGYE